MVSCEIIIIEMTYAALMRLGVMVADIINSNLQAPASEKYYVICGPDFGLEKVGKVALITRDLYGGKVAVRDFWYHLRTCMDFWFSHQVWRILTCGVVKQPGIMDLSTMVMYCFTRRTAWWCQSGQGSSYSSKLVSTLL